MKLINQSHEILRISHAPLELIEFAGRTCYKSEEKITEESSEKFVKMLKGRGHHSVLEHAVATVKFITNRGVTHELVRHRLASYSQESTRYVNYGGKEIEFIRPVWWVNLEQIPLNTPLSSIFFSSEEMNTPECLFLEACAEAERDYNTLLSMGWRPEQAREVLPNALKTEIVVTANFREWIHIFNLRCSPKAHPQIRELMIDCRNDFRELVPVLFD